MRSRIERSSIAENTLILGLYALLQLSALWFHEPWPDELQAWLIARDSGLWELFSERLRYEVTPGLWHLILWIATKFTQDVAAVSLISAVISCITCALIVYASPFPFWVRVALPFTYFFGYQYSIVARNYCLTTLGVALMAITYQARLKRPWPYVLSLIFVAQSSTHGILIATGVALCDLFPLANLKHKKLLLQLTPVFILGVVLALAQIIPRPPDYIVQLPSRGGGGIIYPNLSVWTCLDESLMGFPLLSFIVGAASLLFFYSCGTLCLYLVPTILLMLLFGFGHWAYWHTGNLFLVWYFCTFQSYVQNPEVTRKYWWQFALGLLLVVQVGQTIWTVKRDIEEPYSGQAAAAIDLKHRGLSLKDIQFGGYYSAMLRAYYPRDPDHPGYIVWSTVLSNDGGYTVSEPSYILTTAILTSSGGFVVQDHPGYSAVQVYPGMRPWKGKTIYSVGSLVLLKRDEKPIEKKENMVSK